MTKFSFSFFLLFLIVLQQGFSQAPDFDMDDLDGKNHKLYQDYLDQGIPVILLMSAAWSIFDYNWMLTGYMQQFYDSYGLGNEVGVAVLLMEVDEYTDDSWLDGSNPESYGDWTSLVNFPIINAPDRSIMDDYEIAFFPSIAMVCPDGTIYTDWSDSLTNGNFNFDEELFYGELLKNDEALTEKLYEHCNYLVGKAGVSTKVYFDEDQNCSDEVESGLPNFTVEIADDSTSLSRLTDHDGLTRFLLENGNYNITAYPPNYLWTICNSEIDIEAVGDGQKIDVNIGAQKVLDCPYPVIDITSPILIRCFDSKIYVHYCNEGTIPAINSVIKVELDSFINANNITPTASAYDPMTNTYSFHLGDIEVGECGDIYIDFTLNCEADTAQVHCYSASFTADNMCNVNTIVQPYISDTECQENVFSWDPNDKRAFPLGKSNDNTNIIGPNENIKYQIRFQNEGTWTAYKVVIEDEIPNTLDLSTFKLGASSHPCEVEMVGQKISFIFEDINLPHSDADEEGSHGFVNFFIDQVKDLPLQTNIENTAYIYFDFNEPVVTNTHSYTLGIISRTKEVVVVDQTMISPNPTKSEFVITLSGEEKIRNISILDLNGSVLANISGNYKSNQRISLDLADGIYYTRVSDMEGTTRIQKIVIIN